MNNNIRFTPHIGLKDYDLTIGYIRLHFLMDYKENSEKVILFLHGLGCSSESFSMVLDTDYFPEYTIIIPDMSGFGKSCKDENFSYKLEDTAFLIEKIIDLIPSKEINVVAHSMGGAVGLLFSDKLYDRMKSFVNIEGNLINEDCGIFSRGIVGRSFEDYSTAYDEEKKKHSLSKMLKLDMTNPLVMYRSAQSLVNWSDSGKLLEKFLKLKIRKSYFYGETNRNMSILNHLVNVEKYEISNCGHEVMLDNPEEFYRKLKLFLKRG